MSRVVVCRWLLLFLLAEISGEKVHSDPSTANQSLSRLPCGTPNGSNGLNGYVPTSSQNSFPICKLRDARRSALQNKKKSLQLHLLLLVRS